jgi:hypothetical protein
MISFPPKRHFQEGLQMSIDTTSSNSTEMESESPMFAPTPVWDRARKRRTFGGGRPPAKGVVAPPLKAERIRETYVAGSDPVTGEAPVYTGATAARRSGSGVSAMALAAGVVIVGALAIGGYYAMQPRQSGVAELTPGQPSNALTVANNTVAAPVPAETSPQATASVPPANAEPSAPTVTRSTRVTHHSPAPTVRASRTPSAAESGVNTSATLPATPTPYSATSGAATTPSTAAPTTAVNPMPAARTVAPAPMDTTPSTTTASPPPAMSTGPATSADPSTATTP